jgi:glycosyltransferase involved in cell wall biosynthesis
LEILLITYYWPPAGGSGVQRWLYFSKYLSEFGHQITVITVDPKFASYSSIDESLNEHTKGIEVHKTKTFELIRLYSFLKSGNSKKSIPQGNLGGKKKTFLDKFSSFVRANYFIPDARVGWNPYVIKKANELFKKKKFDTVITTGPPHSTHLVGLKLRERYQFKWIADFRDPWTEVYYNDLFKRTKKNQQKDENQELSVLKNCDLVLTIGPSMKKLLAKKVSADKIEFVYNGFDESLLKNPKRVKNTNFIISYVGTLSANYPYQTLLEAISKLEILNLEVQFTGKIDSVIIDEFNKLTNINFVYNGIKNHQESFNIMFNANVNVLLLPYQRDSQIMITGKVFEYLATGNPILCLGSKESDAVKIIQSESKNSLCCEKEEIDLITSFLNMKNLNHQLVTDSDRLSLKFSKKKLTEDLCNLIKA